MFANFYNNVIELWLEVSPYLLLGMFIAGFLHVFLGADFIKRHLGRQGLLSIIKATFFGVPLPVCSCGVIPLANSLKKDGANTSSVLAFLVSTPTTGVDSILATFSLMGPLFAVFRPLAAFLSGIGVGIMNFLFGEKNVDLPAPEENRKIKVRRKIGPKIRELIYYAFAEVPQDIGKWLLIGTVAGGAIAAFIPGDFFAEYLVFPWDFLAAIIVGVPLYVCATGSIPIAASLILKGFSPGAALVFLIVGPATNAITLSFVRAKLGRRAFYIYLASIIFSAVVLGLLFNYVWAFFGEDPRMVMGHGKMLPVWVKVVCAVLLLGMIAAGFFKRGCRIKNPDIEISVPDIHCGSCGEKIEKALSGLGGVEGVSVDIGSKKVRVKGRVTRDILEETIKKEGYHPEKDLDKT
ncbi:MAG: permease [Candidatus Aureabacteria bacterium]|nr:permease [Candidatus Auribacterota bacterium]